MLLLKDHFQYGVLLDTHMVAVARRAYYQLRLVHRLHLFSG